MDSNERLEEHLENEAKGAISLDDKQEKYLENKVKELHGNIRHITQLAMNWYAFFVTINYLTIGWLAKGTGSENINTSIIRIVALLFIVQNGLGIVGLYRVQKAARAGAVQVSTYENLLLKVGDTSRNKVLERASTPANLYTSLAWSLMAVLTLLMLAWAAIACCYYK